MTDQYVQLAADGAGKKIDTSELTVNSQTVERQRVVIGDPTNPAGLADVTGPNAAPLTTDNGLVVSVSPNSRVTLAAEHRDAFGRIAIAQRQNDFECVFAGNVNMASMISATLTGTGSITQANGQALFSTGGTTGTVDARSLGTTGYRPGAEVYAYFTAYWADSAVGTFQRIGLFDANNGFYVGFEDNKFSVSLRTAGIDTHIAQASFNVDDLTGSATSKFTRAGTPEAVDFTHQNVFRLRFGWVGSAPILYEILSPDGHWILFHQVRQPNTQPTPSIQNPNLPMSVSMSDTGTGCTIGTSCWCAGSSSQFNTLAQPVTASTLAMQTHSVVQGKTTSGNYVDQQVDATGAVVLSGDSIIDVQQLMDAQAPEGAIATFTTGQPGTDFAGVDFMSAMFDDAQGLAARVRITNPALMDAKGAQITSDAPAPILIGGLIGKVDILDTAGYQSLNITTQAYAGSVMASDDLINWQALSGTNRTIAATYVTAVTAANGFSFPCLARYVKFTCTTAGGATVYLRNQPWAPGYATPIANNVAQLGGTNTVAAAGVAGMLAVGGNIATGVAPTAGPVYIAGIDTAGKTRPLLTDPLGDVQVVGTNVPGVTVTPATATAPVQVGGINMSTAQRISASPDGALTVGMAPTNLGEEGVRETLGQIVRELKQMNLFLRQLPLYLSLGDTFIDEDANLRDDPSLFTN